MGPLTRLLARFTPDTDRWRRRIAALAAITAPFALFGTVTLASGTVSGPGFTLLTVVLAVLSLALPAFAVAVFHAPASGLHDVTEPTERLKRRYAEGEIGDAEFDRRLDTLLRADDGRLASDRRHTTDDSRLDGTNTRHAAEQNPETADESDPVETVNRQSHR